eukprot:Skav236795  [mRNA]  locus=scaffold1361:455795:457639:- [translate_table: standard]
MRGGGPQKTTTKQANVIQVKNSLASTMIQEGFELTWISQALDRLVQHVGIRPLLPITNMPHSQSKLQNIRQLLTQGGIEIPSIEPKMTSQPAFHAKTKRKIQGVPDPRNYQVQDGSLLYEDGDVATQLTEFSTHQRGFYLASQEEAWPWLKDGTKLTSDETAILIFGTPQFSGGLEGKQVTLPCIDDQQRSVLVAFTMFQLGEKAIRTKEWDNQKVPQDQAELIALTLWRSDWESQWAQISANPYLFLRNYLGLGSSIVAMWGKSFRMGKKTTTPSEASSLQVHCSIQADAVTNMLRSSGYNHVWATPKTPNGKPSDQWKLLWLAADTDMPATKVLAAKMTGVAGLAKSGNRLAIRINSGSFAQCWKVLHPDEEVPQQIATDHLYRLDSLPFGTTASMISSWGQHQGWQIKPIRALGPKGWLVGSPDHPRNQQMAFNGAPILTRYVRPRMDDRENPIVAGPRPTFHKAAQKAPPLPPLSSDPWARWEGPQQSRAPGPHVTPATPQAAGLGPTDQRFQTHEERFQKLEESMAKMQLHSEQQHAEVANLHQTIVKNETQMKAHVDASIQGLRHEIGESFNQALGKQSSHFDDGMRELKQLILAAKRKQPEGGDEEM